MGEIAGQVGVEGFTASKIWEKRRFVDQTQAKTANSANKSIKGSNDELQNNSVSFGLPYLKQKQIGK